MAIEWPPVQGLRTSEAGKEWMVSVPVGAVESLFKFSFEVLPVYTPGSLQVGAETYWMAFSPENLPDRLLTNIDQYHHTITDVEGRTLFKISERDIEVLARSIYRSGLEGRTDIDSTVLYASLLDVDAALERARGFGCRSETREVLQRLVEGGQ